MSSYLWKAYGIEFPEEEYRFHLKRKWRFDFCWPRKLIALEVEGGIWMGGRGAHSRPINIQRDMEKQNEAGKLGWRIFRFTPKQMKSGEAHQFMKTVLQED